MQISDKSTLHISPPVFPNGNPYFSGRIREIEINIVEFYAEVGRWNGRFPKLSVMYAYFLIHQILTQEQIRQLTGYSKGSVSLYLNRMEKRGLITKKFIEGTHVLQYISTSEKVKIDYLSQAQNKEDLQNINSFCDKVLAMLIENQKTSPKVSANKEFLSHRMGDLKYFIENRIAAHENKWIPINISRFRTNDILTTDRIFDSETEDVEKFIHKTLVEMGVLEANNLKMAQITSYFITRGCLSPKYLIQKTKYSPVTVYSLLRELENQRLIEKISSSRGYEMKSIAISLRLYRFDYYKRLLSWMDTFQTIQNSLRNPAELLFRQHGYPQMYTLIDHILVNFRSLESWLQKKQSYIDKLNVFVKS
jgi:DNA-binding MarR family transcriptional regulator